MRSSAAGGSRWPGEPRSSPGRRCWSPSCLGLVAFTPARAVFALALAIGGMVLSGSSRATTEELRRALSRVEAARNAAIDSLDLVNLGEGTNKPVEVKKRARDLIRRPRLARGRPQGPPPPIDQLLGAAGAVFIV